MTDGDASRREDHMLRPTGRRLSQGQWAERMNQTSSGFGLLLVGLDLLSWSDSL